MNKGFRACSRGWVARGCLLINPVESERCLRLLHPPPSSRPAAVPPLLSPPLVLKTQPFLNRASNRSFEFSTLTTCLMEDLPEPLIAEIIRTARTSDLNSVSLVSKRLYKVEADERGIICVGRGLNPASEALSSVCSRFPNLWSVEINHSGWSSNHGKQLENQGLRVLSSQCPSLTDLTLSFCSYIDDSGLGYLANCKKLMALRRNFVLAISSRGLLSVAVGCKSLSIFHLANCMYVSSVAIVLAQEEYKQHVYHSPIWQGLNYPNNAGVECLEYLGKAGSLVKLMVKDCKGISQYDLLKFGAGWRKLQNLSSSSMALISYQGPVINHTMLGGHTNMASVVRI